MKNFKSYTPEKYMTSDFEQIEEGIYKTKSPYDTGDQDIFVASLAFEMEPECYGEEDASPRNLTQFPSKAFWMNSICLLRIFMNS